MEVGALDRRVTIETATKTKDSYGGIVVSWASLGTYWANVRPMVARERFISGAIRENNVSVFTIRYRTGFDVEARISYDGKLYRIIGIAERGRREWTEITAEVMQ
jgi:SPP1 family predicted phage head-tail adaptor